MGLEGAVLQAEAPGTEVRLDGQGQVFQGAVGADAGPPQAVEVVQGAAYRQGKGAAGDGRQRRPGAVRGGGLPQEGQRQMQVPLPWRRRSAWADSRASCTDGESGMARKSRMEFSPFSYGFDCAPRLFGATIDPVCNRGKEFP